MLRSASVLREAFVLRSAFLLRSASAGDRGTAPTDTVEP